MAGGLRTISQAGGCTFHGQGNAAWISAATHGTYVATDSAVVKVTDPLGAGTTSSVVSGLAFGYIRVGRRLRGTVAALAADKNDDPRVE